MSEPTEAGPCFEDRIGLRTLLVAVVIVSVILVIVKYVGD